MSVPKIMQHYQVFARMIEMLLDHLVEFSYDHHMSIHLSSEAQCVSHLYPQVDCHSHITK